MIHFPFRFTILGIQNLNSLLDLYGLSDINCLSLQVLQYIIFCCILCEFDLMSSKYWKIHGFIKFLHCWECDFKSNRKLHYRLYFSYLFLVISRRLGDCMAIVIRMYLDRISYSTSSQEWVRCRGKDPNLHPETIKVLEENAGKDFLEKSSKSIESQYQSTEIGLYQTKKFLHSKGNNQQNKRAINRAGQKSLHTTQQTGD